MATVRSSVEAFDCEWEVIASAVGSYGRMKGLHMTFALLSNFPLETGVGYLIFWCRTYVFWCKAIKEVCDVWCIVQG